MRIEMELIDRAFKVVSELRKLPDIPELLIFLDSYNNCREQGFQLNAICEKITIVFLFSEDRNSDDIVVYWQLGSFNRAFSASVMTNKMYKNRKYFSNETDAAKFIFDTITENIKAKG